jgi:transposase InsO family protein
MAWKETDVMHERLKFIATLLEGEVTMAALCRHYGISRKTGYKLKARYDAFGLEGLADRSRAPLHHPRAVSVALVEQVLDARAAHPSWGPRKLLAYLKRHHPARTWPAPSTVGELLRQHGVTRPPGRVRHATPSAPLAHCTGANDVWCIDFKGWFRTLDGRRCDPLTLTDGHSRLLLRCQVVARPDEAHVRPLLEGAFREYGLPRGMRSDNGPPFASSGLGGLSRLSVWWIRLGIRPERIEPGKPQQNGRHERMHRTLLEDAAEPPRKNAREQQKAFDTFRREYNEQRPHEALGQSTPAEHYAPSARAYPRRLAEVEYPGTMQVRRVRGSGEVKWGGRSVYLSEALANEPVGFEPVSGPYWRVHYGPVALALWNEQTRKLLREPREQARARDPEGVTPPKCHPCRRSDL